LFYGLQWGAGFVSAVHIRTLVNEVAFVICGILFARLVRKRDSAAGQ
jgi:hypothetical protein